jgi:hypothetical protein
VPLQHRRGDGFEFRGLVFEVLARPTPLLRRVAGELHAINGEHRAPDQPLLIADRHHAGEHPRDLRLPRTHEVGDGREVRRGVAAERDEGDMLAARLFDPATADQPARIGEEHDLQEQGGRIRWSPGLIISKARIERREIDRAVEQVVEGMFEGARMQLLR